MRHVALLGDSIFDNASYVRGQSAVIDQLREALPDDWNTTLLAVDGDVTSDVTRQLVKLPTDVTDLIVSVGGNDALGYSHVLDQAKELDELQKLLFQPLAEFQQQYAAMLDAVAALERNTFVCTVYDQCPFDDPRWRELVPIALNSFNEVILREANQRGMGIVELREICTAPEDYSAISPIEPSAIGGAKIVDAIVRCLKASDA